MFTQASKKQQIRGNIDVLIYAGNASSWPEGPLRYGVIGVQVLALGSVVVEIMQLPSSVLAAL
jgi:hypothetical protein